MTHLVITDEDWQQLGGDDDSPYNAVMEKWWRLAEREAATYGDIVMIESPDGTVLEIVSPPTRSYADYDIFNNDY